MEFRCWVEESRHRPFGSDKMGVASSQYIEADCAREAAEKLAELFDLKDGVVVVSIPDGSRVKFNVIKKVTTSYEAALTR